MVHLTVHFKEGGIGLLFLTDVYMYEHLPLNRVYLETEFRKLGIFAFYKNIKALAFHWFGDSEEQASVSWTPTLAKLEVYILSCGVYGNAINAENLNAGKGKFTTLMKHCFPNYASMKTMFPWLKPILLPYGWILRGVRAAKYRKSHIEWAFISSVRGDKKQGEQLCKFYHDCGLDV